jgi:hypothetical protein
MDLIENKIDNTDDKNNADVIKLKNIICYMKQNNNDK